jgi:hypothetical protein
VGGGTQFAPWQSGVACYLCSPSRSRLTAPNPLMNSRSLVILAILILAVVGAALWFLQSAPPPVVPELVLAPPAKLDKTTTVPTPAETAIEPQPKPIPAEPKPEPKPAQIAEWENKIDAVLRANPDSTEAANRATTQLLINLLPTLPPEGQAEAAQHITNLLEDKDYSKVIAIVKNPQMPEEVLDVFVTDLMNRDDSVKLPTLLEIAKIPNHPHHEEAQTDLNIFLDEDFGNDWGKWEVALKAYLKKQADEAAAEALPPAKQ